MCTLRDRFSIETSLEYECRTRLRQRGMRWTRCRSIAAWKKARGVEENERRPNRSRPISERIRNDIDEHGIPERALYPVEPRAFVANACNEWNGNETRGGQRRGEGSIVRDLRVVRAATSERETRDRGSLDFFHFYFYLKKKIFHFSSKSIVYSIFFSFL